MASSLRFPSVLLLGVTTWIGALTVAGCDTEKDASDPGSDDGTEARSVVGASTEEAAEIIADSVCDHVAACGTFVTTCTEPAEGGTGSCTTERVAGDYDACIEQTYDDVLDDLACVALTDDEAAVVDACLAAMTALPCPSVEDVQSGGGDAEGTGPAVEPPEACAELEAIFERCGDRTDPDDAPDAAPAPDGP